MLKGGIWVVNCMAGLCRGCGEVFVVEDPVPELAPSHPAIIIIITIVIIVMNMLLLLLDATGWDEKGKSMGTLMVVEVDEVLLVKE